MYKGRVLMESEKRRICELYPGETINELASEFKVSSRRIKQILVEAKIPVPKRGRAMSRKLTEEEKKRIAELYENTSIRELSKVFGVPYYTITDALKEKGVNIRPKGTTIESVKLRNETSVRPLKKEEITMPMPSVSVSAADARMHQIPILRPIKDENLPLILTHAMDVLQTVYFTPTDADVMDDLDEIFNQAVSMASDILFAPKNLGSGLHYEEYTRLIMVNDILKRILLKIDEQYHPWYDKKEEEMQIRSGNWYAARLFIERAVSRLADSD